MGTLVVFLAVAVALMLLRHQQPDRAPGFRVPAYPFTPLISIAACLYLITNLSITVYAIFALWMALALLFYGAYARHGAARERLVECQTQGNIAT
jgi:amino acid transporter